MANDFTKNGWCPDLPAQREEKWRLRTARFGDGYEERVLDGINALEEKWSVKYSNRRKEEILSIDAFLKAVGANSFEFYERDIGDTIEVYCDGWLVEWDKKTNGDGLLGSVTVEFRRVYSHASPSGGTGGGSEYILPIATTSILGGIKASKSVMVDPISGIATVTTASIGAAPLNHKHEISDVLGLQTALDAKADDSDLIAIKNELALKVPMTSSSGAAVIPVGTEALRPKTPFAGYFRFNADTRRFEGFDGVVWGDIGAGGAIVSISAPNGPSLGMLWFNPETGELFVWDGSEWRPVGGSNAPATAFLAEFSYIAEQGQTVFSGPDIFGATPEFLTPEGVNVFYNGSRLLDKIDWNVTDGSTLVLTKEATKESVVTIELMTSTQEGSILPATSKKIETYRWQFNGVQKTFPIFVEGQLFSPGDALNILLSLGGTMQDANIDYAVSGSNIIFDVAPLADTKVWAIVGIPIGSGGGSGPGTPYPAPSSFIRCTYLASNEGQTDFGGSDKIGNVLSGLQEPGAIAIVHVNGVRIEDEDYSIVSDSSINLTRGVSVGSSVIIEVFTVAANGGAEIVPEHNHDCGVF